MWKDYVVYQSEFYRQKNKNISRSGYHVLVCALSIHIYSICVFLVLIMPSSQFVDNSRISKSQECWYVIKVLIFFNFKIDDRPESFYILGELLEGSLSPTNNYIPRPANDDDDVEACFVSSFKYVVTPGDALSEKLLKNPGKVSNLFLPS
ncbi:hypothetical protein BDF20DRAFT_903667 [Mycotypha africana]|uniref:uncharacterized protein n=1 Tax=Mycotypha africana TaxID=64632 RepID=UPI002300818E|nr:uncharacterized protein BDF20DRAFT_903667 [Mycotypha africana]KAI8966906.1 hypothetical protein BDF20DRAFT_903667 [Mycotypha africana]